VKIDIREPHPVDRNNSNDNNGTVIDLS